MSNSEIIKSARDFFVENPARWVKGSGGVVLEDGSKTACILTALWRKYDEGVTDPVAPATKLIREAIKESQPNVATSIPHISIASWNDEEDRTIEQVVAVLDRAMVLAEEKEAA